MGQHSAARSSEYERDFFAWTQRQARMLKALARSSSDLGLDIDFHNVAEEIATLGRMDLYSVRSAIQRSLIHMIKAADGDDMAGTIFSKPEVLVKLHEIQDLYTPSMRGRVDVDELWREALKIVAEDVPGLCSSLMQRFPAGCPFTLDDFVQNESLIDDGVSRLRIAAPAI